MLHSTYSYVFFRATVYWNFQSTLELSFNNFLKFQFHVFY